MSISNYLENALLDAVFNATSFSVADVYMSLHTADPGETGASEVTGGSYARQVTTFGAAASGAVANDSAESFTMPAATVTHVGLWDDASAGNFLWGGAATASKTYGSGDTATVAIGDLDITLD